MTDDAGLRAYLRATLNSYKHPVGTCRIGEDDMVPRSIRLMCIALSSAASLGVAHSDDSQEPEETGHRRPLDEDREHDDDHHGLL